MQRKNMLFELFIKIIICYVRNYAIFFRVIKFDAGSDFVLLIVMKINADCEGS